MEKQIYQLLVQASTSLPEDVENKIRQCRDIEAENSNARATLQAILENVQLARKRKLPICQDTGMIIFFVEIPEMVPFSQKNFKNNAENAVKRATADGVLRQNSVCSLSGKNSGNNVGKNSPMFYFNENQNLKDEIKINVILKGGGSENVSAQYSLPDKRIGADRNLAGVRKCILDAAIQAQGRGCAPGILSVIVGGDRASAYELAKHQLLHKIGERNTNLELAKFEEKMFNEINSLEIGPMGFGGKTTILDFFIDFYNRVPASFFVTISYMCWACRRAEISIKT